MRRVFTGLAFMLAIGAFSEAARADNYWIRIENEAGYNIRVRTQLNNGGWSNWSGTIQWSGSVNYTNNASPGSILAVELQWNNGSSWKHLCTQTLAPISNAMIKAKGTLFSKSCSLDRK